MLVLDSGRILHKVHEQHRADESDRSEYTDRRERLDSVLAGSFKTCVGHGVGKGDCRHVERHADRVEDVENAEIEVRTDQIRSFGQVDVAHRVQSGAEHRDTCDELAERQCLLCGDPSVGHDADEGWHKYGDESLCGEEKPDLGTKPGLAEKTSHRCQVRSPDGVLEEVHNDQPEADVLVAHNVIVFFVIMRMVKTNKCTSFRLKITIFEG